MPRLIDAERLLMDNTWAFYDRFGNRTSAGLAVEEAPTVDAEAVRHGHWIALPVDDEETFKCSECGDEEYYFCNYCPNCGAKMDAVAK